jgi:tetratricopeptide (TPR) repeat protein
VAEAERLQAEKMLEDERQEDIARLKASRWIGDLLFAWAMEKGHRSLPPLDGRELRLKKLERYFEDFLDRSEKTAGLAEERARACLQLAEISLAAGNFAQADKRLAEVMNAAEPLPMNGELKLRVGTNFLWLALLRQSNGDDGTRAAFATARIFLAKLPRADVDTQRLDQVLAILDFHEAKLLSASGDETKALEQLMRATQTLIRIKEQSPDSAVLGSALANCYLSSATILEVGGNLADAREVRGMALVQLRKIHQENPRDLRSWLDLAACYSAMSEDALLSGDVPQAEIFSREAMVLLDRILIENPENSEAITRKAGQLGLRAGILRDRGQAPEAMKGFDEGIRMLEGLDPEKSGNRMAAYRLALLWWQKGRLVGMGGLREDEIELIFNALQMLDRSVGKAPDDEPTPEQLRRAKAYLQGDLGHALHLANRKNEAIRAFADAIKEWQELSNKRPHSEEYTEGLLWCKQRLDDLK